MQKIFIIPGYGERATNKRYVWLCDFLRGKGFKIVYVPMRWKEVLSKNAEDFRKFYEKKKGKVNYIWGFSYGATVALAAGNLPDLKTKYLCSISPVFKEDMKKMDKTSRKVIGKKQFEDSKTLSSTRVAKKSNVPIVVFYGEGEAKEYPPLKLRAEKIVKDAPRAKLIVVPHAIHDPRDLNYIEAVKKEFNLSFK